MLPRPKHVCGFVLPGVLSWLADTPVPPGMQVLSLPCAWILQAFFPWLSVNPSQ